MGRAALVISRMHVASALRNPVSWIAAAAAILYTVIVSVDEPFHLAQAGIELGLLEMALHVFSNNLYYTTWGLFMPFLFIVSPMLYETGRERLVAMRAGSRLDLWAAKSIAVLKLSAIFAAAAVALSLAVITPKGEISPLQWTGGYTEVVRKVASEPEGSLDPNYHIVANEYLVQAWRPVTAAAAQAGLLALALAAAASLFAALAQRIERQALTFIAVGGYWLLILAPTPALSLISPQAHLVLELRSDQFPFWASAVYLLASLAVFNAAGWHGKRKAVLG